MWFENLNNEVGEHYCFKRICSLTPFPTPHPAFLAVGIDAQTRHATYRALLTESLSADDLTAIRDHMRQERALGSPRFQAMVEQALGRPAAIRRPGRPAAVALDSNGSVL